MLAVTVCSGHVGWKFTICFLFLDPPDGDFSLSDPGLGDVVKPKPRPRTKLPQAAPRGGAPEVLPVHEEGQDRDLHVTIEERERVGFKSDIYISYKVCTEVSFVLGRPGALKLLFWSNFCVTPNVGACFTFH